MSLAVFLKSVAQWLLAALVLITSSGCSVKMLYNNADRFSRWAVNDYIQMDDEQEAYFDTEIDALLYWHRTQELPRYADFLDSMPARFEKKLSEDDVLDVFETFSTWWEALGEKAMPMVTELVLSLSDEQVTRLPERLEEDNRKLAEDEFDKPVEQVQAEWAKEYMDTMSRFTGRLTREQREYLTAQSVRYVPQFELWAEYRERWQRDLLELLNTGRENPETFALAFQKLAESRESYYGEELTAIFDANEALAAEITAWLINQLNEKQRERFNERIGEMANDFRELAADVPDEIPEGGGCLVRC